MWRWQFNAVSSDDETTTASFPSGSTYFSNDNEVILILITYGILWHRVISSIHSPRTRSAAKNSRDWMFWMWIRFVGMRRKYKNRKNKNEIVYTNPTIAGVTIQVYAYTISTITLSCNYRAIHSCWRSQFVLFIVRFAFVVYSIWVQNTERHYNKWEYMTTEWYII